MVDAVEEQEKEAQTRQNNDVANRIDALEAGISKGTRSDVLSGIIGALKLEQMKINDQGKGAGTAHRIANAAIRNAAAVQSEQIAEEQKETAEIVAKTSGMVAGAGTFAYTQQVFNLMTEQEQNYLLSFNPSQTYQMATVGADGTITLTQETATGAELQDDFARVKFSSLTKEERYKIQGPNAPASAPEDELTKLEASLHRLEGHKLGELHARGAEHEEGLRVHERFIKAHDQIENVRHSRRMLRDLQENDHKTWKDQVNQTTANIALDYNNTRLEQILKEDVLPTLIKEPGESQHQHEEKRGYAMQHADIKNSGLHTRPTTPDATPEKTLETSH